MKHLFSHIALIIVLGIVLPLTVGCKPGVPSEYIQPGDLEDILYDYHVADGMATQKSGNHDFYLRAYRLAVLKKHGITEAELDSSLVYYTRHTELLHQIYEHLAKRLSDEAVALGASASGIDRYNTLSTTGDTASIWKGESSAIFVPKPPFNQLSFSVKADTTFHKGDVILLHFRAQFIYQDGIRDGVAVLAVRFGNDSITSQMMRVTSSDSYTLQVRDDNHLGIKEVSGFIMLNKSLSPDQPSTTLQMMAVNRLRLIRIHEQKNKKADKAAADSIKTDSVPKHQELPAEPASSTEVPPAEPSSLPNEIPTR